MDQAPPQVSPEAASVASHRDDPSRPPWQRRALVVALALLVLVPVGWAVVREVRGVPEPVPFASADVRGTTLTVDYVGSECRTASSLEVEEHADRVVVTVMERERSGGCSDLGVLHTARGRLDDPLGDRRLVDGACLTEEWGNRPACMTTGG